MRDDATSRSVEATLEVERDRVEYRVLGPVEVHRDGEPVVLGPLKQRALLALLLMNANQVVSTDRIIDELWGDGAGKDRQNALWVIVSGLRSALEPEREKRTEGTVLVTRTPGYVLSIDAGAVDAVRFERLAVEGRGLLEVDAAASSLVLSEALALWRGHALEEFTYESFAQAEIARLEELRLASVEDRIAADLRVGRSRELIGELESLVRQHPHRERFTGHLMVALHRSGRQADALRAFGNLRAHLAGELGLDPSSELAELEERIVLDDPTLRQPESARVAGGRPEPGLSVRGYELRDKIGEGALGYVYRAYQPAIGREVAIKVIRAELANDPEFIRRFESEAQIVARLEHPQIVPLFDYWREPDSAYLVMRRFEHGSLQEALDEGPLSAEMAARIIEQLGAALGAAHGRNVLHGDIKPANILIDGDGNAYLADFGMSIGGGFAGSHESSLSTLYAAPEQMNAGEVTVQSDIYSLAVVADHALRGATGDGERSDAPLVGPVAAVIARATAHDSAQRHTDVGSFLEELGIALREPTAPASRLPIEADNPYVGLRSFEEGDAGRFFGRERLIERLLARLGHAGPRGKLIALVGPSGFGKSSVVRAGLVPAVRNGALPGSDRWFIVTMTPGHHPFEALEEALLKVAVDPPASVLERLTSGGIAETVEALMPDPDSHLLLVVDQLEELFSHASGPDADAFLSAIAAAAGDRHSRVKTIVTLRADFYDHPLRHGPFGELLRLGTEVITPMTADELERAISSPAEAVGVSFEPGLVAQILTDMSGQSAALPLMQYALTELFERSTGTIISVESYQNLGGVSAALVRRADSLYEGLDADARASTRDVFLRLVTLGEGSEDTRRRALRSELTEGGGDGVPAALDTFGRHRLLSFDRDPITRSPTVEIAHEALLTEWRRLKDWINDARTDIQAQRRLALAASEWREREGNPDFLLTGERFRRYGGWLQNAPLRLTEDERSFLAASHAAADLERHAEQRRVRRLRRLVSGVAVALVIAIVAGSVALNQRNQAQAAVDQADLATLISRSASMSIDEPEVSILLALEAYRRAPGPETEQAVLNALGSSTITNRVSSIGPLNPDGECKVVSDSRDGATQFGVAGGQLVSRDTSTGAVAEHGPPPADCVRWFGDEQANLRWAGTQDGRRMWFGPYDGPWGVEIEHDVPTLIFSRSFKANNTLLFLSDPDGDQELRLLDARTGAPVGAPFEVDGFVLGDSDGFTEDGSLIAAGIGFVGGDATSSQTVIFDGTSGDEMHRIAMPLPPSATAFDEATGQLIAAIVDGTIVTIELATGAIVSEVQSTATAEPREVGVRPDGLIALVTPGQVELIDRQTGPTGRTFDLQNVEFARVRPDGTVLTTTADDRTDIFDLDANPLVTQTWDVDGSSVVAFNAGFAAVEASGGPEIVELATGARSTPEFSAQSGDRLITEFVYPDAGGVWAVDESGNIRRWEDGQVVESIDGEFDVDYGGRVSDRWVVLSGESGTEVATLVSLERGNARVVFEIPVSADAYHVHPALDGGIHILGEDGTLTTYDDGGQLVAEVATPAEKPLWVATDPESGRLAVAAQVNDGKPFAPVYRSVMIVDPITGESQQLPRTELVWNLGFGRDGILAVTNADGTVRLWDTARGVPAGLVWDGSGVQRPGSPSWYDETTDSMWVASSGKLLQIPLDPQRWVDRACDVVGRRNLTQDEWDRLVPGSGPVQSACG